MHRNQDSSDILWHDFYGLVPRCQVRVQCLCQRSRTSQSKTRHNPVWHKPVSPPDMLRGSIEEVIEWAKSVETVGDTTAPQCRLGRRCQWQSFRWRMAAARSKDVIYLTRVCTYIHFVITTVWIVSCWCGFHSPTREHCTPRGLRGKVHSLLSKPRNYVSTYVVGAAVSLQRGRSSAGVTIAFPTHPSIAGHI